MMGPLLIPLIFISLYTQVIFGEEELPYLKKKIESAVLETETHQSFPATERRHTA